MGCLRQPGPDPAPPQISTPARSGSRRFLLRPAYNPFVSHAFFAAAEASGSARARTGWGPRHPGGAAAASIVGIVPCYLKSHCQGEYVFDHGWADAFERAGGRYYPKLQVVGAVHAGHRSAPAGPRPASIADSIGARAGERPDGAVQRHRRLIRARHLRAARPKRSCWASTASCSAPTSSSTGTTTATRLRRFPRHAGLAQAQGDQARAARGAGRTASRSTG